MSATWLVLRHIAHEHLGTLAAALDAQGIRHRYLDAHRGDAIPASPEAWGGLVVMGGPMGVYEQDRYPFLRHEMELIRHAAHAGRPVLGICLGAQLIAAALGARVYPGGRKEIGWYGIRKVAPNDRFSATLPEHFMGFHWHGDTFDLPAGALRLFESDLYPNQGFRWGGNVLALQFHFEVDRPMVDDWLADADCRSEVESVEGISLQGIQQDTAAHGAALEQLSAAYFAAILPQLISPAADKR